MHKWESAVQKAAEYKKRNQTYPPQETVPGMGIPLIPRQVVDTTACKFSSTFMRL